jgi:hypothetical protein
VLAGCSDQIPTRSSTGEFPTPQGAAMDVGQLEHLRAVPRYIVDLDAAGSLRPGHPIHLTATVEGKLPTKDVEIRIFLPEVAAAEQSGWDVVHIPRNTELAPQARARQSLGRGQRTHVSANLTIPEPGYYMALASVIQKSGEPLVEADGYVQNVIHKEIWLWIDENGGRITDAYDESVFPAGVRHQPGPRSTYEQAPRLRAPRNADAAPQRNLRTTTASGWTGGQVSYWITYVHKDSLRYNELTGQIDNKFPVIARGTVRIYDAANQIVESWSDNIDDDSYVEISCYAGGRYEMEITFESNAWMALNPKQGGSWSGYFSTDCGISTLGLVNANRAHLWRNLSKATLGASFFGIMRPWIEVDVDGGTGSYYCPGANFSGCRTSDYIHISTQPNSNGYEEHIWGVFGTFVAGHEYGHAYHNKALNAQLATLYPGCPGHSFGALLSMGCAYFEGFANYYAVAVLGRRAGYITDEIEANSYFPGGDGSRYEDAVAAFLMDITDSQNNPYFTADDDAVWYYSEWMGAVIRTCEVYAGGAWRRPTGIDHIVYCMEGQVDGAITSSTNYFPSRSPDPTAQRNSATLPYGYSQSAVRTLWLRNLYRHTSFSPTY